MAEDQCSEAMTDDRTPDDVLADIADRLDDEEKTELTDDEQQTLGIVDERTPSGYRPKENRERAIGKRDTISVSYYLYNIDGMWLAVREAGNLAGEKRTRRYAYAVGETLSLDPAGLDRTHLQEGLDARGVEYTDADIEAADEMYQEGERVTISELADEFHGLIIDYRRLHADVMDSGTLTGPAVAEIDEDDDGAVWEAVVGARRASRPDDIYMDACEAEARFSIE